MQLKIILLLLLFSTTVKIQAQADERIYFNDGTWETGIILRIVPDSLVTLKKASGEIKTYRTRNIKKIVKRMPELLEAGSHNQTIAGAFSINGGVQLTKYEESMYHYILNPSFNIYPVTNMSMGLVLFVEKLSNDLSFHGANYMAGGNIIFYIGQKASKPFAGAEVAMRSESDLLYEFSLITGYNYAITSNIAIQPVFKLGFLNFQDSEIMYNRITIGIGLANYIF